MKEQMKFVRKLPEPIEVQQEIPLRAPYRKLKAERDQAIEDIMTGKDDRLLLIIGPCSADNEPAVLDYCTRLAKVADEVKDKLSSCQESTRISREPSAKATKACSTSRIPRAMRT